MVQDSAQQQNSKYVMAMSLNLLPSTGTKTNRRRSKNENDNNNKQNTGVRESTLNDTILLRNLYHNDSNCRCIYTNPDTYACVDAGDKGGFLIQATKQVFCNQNLIYGKTLDSIVNKTKSLVRHDNATMESVEDLNKMNFDIVFQKQHNSNKR